ncbi:NAD-dependent epimerase/dehydratase family protein [bacterium]|nr:NAD-dependent epimerase/dehydratase family protein [bacterium]
MGIRVAITGVNSYFASTILPRLEEDPEIEEIVGIDVSPWKGGYEKVTFYREDIRSKKIFEILKGVDVVYHLAFIVGEIHDKSKTLDININGSKNVFTACADNRVKKVIYTSSMTIYGAHESNPLGFTENSPVSCNDDSYYNSSKVKVEAFVADFFKDHPDITLTIIRAGLLCGPKINNMFSALWSKKISALPMGRNSYNQLIHEEDLGEALYLSLKKDLPGIYNVCADDALPTRWMFRKAGVKIVFIPAWLLKIIINILFFLRIEKVSQGWVSLSEHTIYGICDKFKKAAGWLPRYSSADTFDHYLKARQRDRKDTIKQSFLTWLYTTPLATKLSLTGLNASFFLIEKTPWLRNIVPMTDPKKNNMTYLPNSRNIVDNRPKTIAINESAGEMASEIIPLKILDDMIETNSYHIIMDKCICRTGFNCSNFTNEIGCLFMGETAKKLPPGLGRQVTKEAAHRHAKKASDIGLVPMVGKVNVDNLGFLTRDTKQLLSVCFCCHCCCMMGFYKHDKEHLQKLFRPMEGIMVKTTEDCIGCGTCVETCIFDNIVNKNGVTTHGDHCTGCGRCEATCENGGVEITLNNPDYAEDVKKRIQSFIKIPLEN